MSQEQAAVEVSNAPLTTTEAAKLAECEDVISRGLQTFIEVGYALAAVQESRLYRATHRTFDEYCAERWNLSRSYASRLTQASMVMEMLPIGNIQVLPEIESQVRPMTRLLPPAGAKEKVAAAAKREIQETWNESVATAPISKNGEPKVTGDHVEKTVARRRAAAAEASPAAADQEDEKPAQQKRRASIEGLSAQRRALRAVVNDMSSMARAAEKISCPLHPDLTAKETAQLLSDLNGARTTMTVLARHLKEHTNAKL